MRRTDKIICKSLITTFAKKTLRYLLKRYNNANGQVIVEYVLFSILVLAIMGAFMKAFNTANIDYLERVFGDEYLGCLLRKGQLPQLGSQAGPDACPPPLFKFDGNVPEYPVPPVPAAPQLSDNIIPITPAVPIAPEIPRPPPIPPPPNLSSNNISSFAGNKGAGTGAGFGKGGGAGTGSGAGTGTEAGRGLSDGIGGGNRGGIVPINKAAGAGDLGGGGDQFYPGQGGLGGKGRALVPIKKSKKDGAKKSIFGGGAVDDTINSARRRIRGSRVIELSEREKQELAENTQTAIFQQGVGSAFKKRVVPLAVNKVLGGPVEDEPLELGLWSPY